MKDESGARPQVVYETTVGAHHFIRQRVQLRDLNIERRVVHGVRQLQPETDTGGAERHTQIGADAEIQRELRFQPQFVDGDEERLAKIREILVDGDVGRRRRTMLDEHLQRRADALLDVVGDGAKYKDNV